MTEHAGPAALTAGSLLAPPGGAADWRLVLLVDAAADAGLLDALPGTAADLAARLDLDADAVRVMLDALAAADVVRTTGGEDYGPGPGIPGGGEVAAVRHQARAIRSWSTTLPDRLRGVAAEFARRGLDVTLQDLPEMLEVVRHGRRIEAAGVRLFAGDFFDVLPDGPFDLIFCAGVTHTFDGEHNRALYPRLRSLLAPGGGLVIITFLRRHDTVAPLFAVHMLVVGRGGDTHAESDYREWLADAGFGSVEVHDIDDRAESLLIALP